MNLFAGADVCVTLVRTVAEAAADPSLREREVIPRLKDTPGRVANHTPRLGN